MYKLTKAAYVESILSEAYLWFSHIDQLNDPFECNIEAFEYSGETYRREQSEYFRRRQMLPGRFGTSTPNHFYDHPGMGIGVNDPVLEQIQRKMNLYGRYMGRRKRLYVLSLTETNLSPAMWAHYGDEFKGVCLKLDTGQLEHALGECSHEWKRIAVEYTLEKPSLAKDLSQDIEALVSHKHEDWSYEREVRYVLWVEDPDPREEPGLRIPIGDAVSEVHVADDTDREVTERILSCVGEERVKVITKSRLGWLEERAYQ